MGLKLAVLLAVAFVSFRPSAQAGTNFLAGADFSFFTYFTNLGVVYKDGGVATNGIQILKNHGINCVRLRLFTSSQAQAATNAYNYINNTNYTVPLAVQVKNAGLLFLLDFHYSDTWADTSHQAIPSAWSGLNSNQLVQQMVTYNSNTIATFAAAGAMPDYVQIGNEITDGILYPDGGPLSGSGTPLWAQFAKYLNAAIQGIQDASTAAGKPMPKIIVHIDQGGNWATTEWFFDNLEAEGVPFDIIGESYYPFYQGSLTALGTCLSNTANTFCKPIIVAETAFPWTNTCPSAWLSGSDVVNTSYPPTESGQVSFLEAENQIVASVPNGLGLGVFYWGGEYQAASIAYEEAGFNTSSFFDAGGNLLPSLNAFVASALSARPPISYLYQENFGATAETGLTLAEVGWNQVLGSGGYGGIYAQPNAIDVSTGQSLPASAAYFGGSSSGTGIFYTTNGAGSGTSGTSAFTSIDPTLYSNLTFSVETQESYQGGNVTSSFAVQVGGAWYVSTNKITPYVESQGGTNFLLTSLMYNPIASGWNQLTIGGSSVTVGSEASSNLSGPITGIGIVVKVASGGGSWDYSDLLIKATAPCIVSQPTNLSVALGGNANFAVGATGAPTLLYQWQFDNTNLAGATNSAVVLGNIQASNAGPYQVVLTNSYGAVTSAVALLGVTGVPTSFFSGPGGLQLSNGQFLFSLTGLTGQGAVVIDGSTNLVQWVPIFTNPSAFGAATIIDSNAGLFPWRFYRALTPSAP
jgi:arabinogalactan endo-1,4-beta-galactosidase